MPALADGAFLEGVPDDSFIVIAVVVGLFASRGWFRWHAK